MADQEHQIQEERGKVYGDHHHGNQQVGRVWAAILSQKLQIPVPDIPADIVDLMMAGVKIVRMSQDKGRGHEDSVTDARVYISMAAESVARYRAEEP